MGARFIRGPALVLFFACLAIPEGFSSGTRVGLCPTSRAEKIRSPFSRFHHQYIFPASVTCLIDDRDLAFTGQTCGFTTSKPVFACQESSFSLGFNDFHGTTARTEKMQFLRRGESFFLFRVISAFGKCCQVDSLFQ